MKMINWAALPHCPEGQLVKANPTDAGYDIKIAQSVVIKPYSELSYTWKDLATQDAAKLELPELFEPSATNIFLNQDGLRLKSKNVVEFKAEAKKAVWVALNKVGCISIADHTATSFRVETRSSKEALANIDGVLSVQECLMLQRKEYLPIKIATGIKIQPEALMWFGLVLRSSVGKYGVSQAHSIGVIDYSYDGELLVSIYALNGHAVFMKGERLAQLVPMNQEELTLRQVNADQIRITNRGGFGASGNDLEVRVATA